MLAFRSEAHVDRWCERLRIPKGAVFTAQQAWGLGREWYATRLEPRWRRRTSEEAEAVFASLGLTGPLWRLRRP
jgi:Alkylmercury lyase